MNIEVDQAEFNVILAALRLFQMTDELPARIEEIAEPNGASFCLSDDEIDDLCERLNCGRPSATVRPTAAENALLAIQETLDGVEWNIDTLEDIADVLLQNGYRIRDLDDVDLEASSESADAKPCDAIISAAGHRYRDDDNSNDINFDQCPVILEADEGWRVQAWLWVPREDVQTGRGA